jgi:hypothetical protein
MMRLTISFRAAFRFIHLLPAIALLSLGGCNRSETVTESSSAGPNLQYGDKISFGQGGNSDSYKKGGWSKTEEKFTWTEGTSAQLRFSVPATDDSVTMRIKAGALIKPPELPFQPVEVFVNDQKIADWQMGETSIFEASIPRDVTKAGGVLTVVIKIPKATSPKTLALSADPRVLGVCFLEVELVKG